MLWNSHGDISRISSSPHPTDAGIACADSRSDRRWHQVLSPATMMTNQIHWQSDPVLRPRLFSVFSRSRWRSSLRLHRSVRRFSWWSACLCGDPFRLLWFLVVILVFFLIEKLLAHSKHSHNIFVVIEGQKFKLSKIVGIFNFNCFYF